MANLTQRHKNNLSSVVNKITSNQQAERRSNDRWDNRLTWNNRRLPSHRTSTRRKTGSEQLHRYKNLLQFAFLDVTPAHMSCVSQLLLLSSHGRPQAMTRASRGHLRHGKDKNS